MNLFDIGQKQLQKDNLDRHARNLLDFIRVANPDIKEVMKALAQHGHAHILGFGEFYVSEKAGGLRHRRSGPSAGSVYCAPGRREVRFKAGGMLMNMLNQDLLNEDGVPTPNPQWWKGEDEVIFR